MLSSYRRAVVTLLRTVRVSAIGCALTHELTEGMSFQVIRNAETAVIKCAHSNQHWPLVCTGDRWQGSVGQCAPQGQSGQRLATISLWIQINISDIFVAWGWHLYQLVTGTWCGYSRNAVIITFSYPRRSNLLSFDILCTWQPILIACHAIQHAVTQCNCTCAWDFKSRPKLN